VSCPGDWVSSTLESVCVAGGLVRGPFGGSLKKSDFVATGFQVYEQRNAIQSLVEGRYFINPEKFRKMARFAVREGDFIVSCSGTIGRIFRIPSSAPPGIINQALLKISVDVKVIDSGYFEQYFCWDEFQESITDSTQGGAMKNLVGMPVFKKTVIMHPGIDEQRAIATVLGDVDELIKSLDALLAKKEAIKQGMMQELLTSRVRLPGFESSWSSVALGSVGRTYGGLAGKSADDFGCGNGRYIEFMDVMANIRIDGSRLAKVRVSSKEHQNTVRNGDLLLNGSSETPDELAMAAVVVDVPSGTMLNSFCFGFRLADGAGVEPEFLAYLLRAEPGRHLLASAAQGATRYNLSRRQFLQLQVTLPPIDEQQAIASVLRDLDQDISMNEARLTKARDVKQGMMQELLSGRTRLHVEAMA
jgi:type I restriction enzyme S subunit